MKRSIYLDGEVAPISPGEVGGSIITLKLAAPSGARTITYLKGRDWDGTPEHLIRGANGIAALTFCEVGIASSRSAVPARIHFEPTVESLQQYETPEWFEDAKLGIYMHWGPQSIPDVATTWYARWIHEQGSEGYTYTWRPTVIRPGSATRTSASSSRLPSSTRRRPSGLSSSDYLYARLLTLAERAGDTAALAELKALGPYPGARPSVEKMLTVRTWARRYNGGWYGKPTFDLMFSLDQWAPEYTQADVDAQVAATQRFTRNLTGGRGGGRPVSSLTSQKVPVIVIQGRHDLHTPYEPAKAFFDMIQAPHKRFITLERAAHAPMFEQPGEFLLTLIREVLPLTEGQARF